MSKMLETLEIDVDKEIVKLNGVRLIPIFSDDQSPTGEAGSTKFVFLADHYIVKFTDEENLNWEDATPEFGFEPDPEDIKHFAKVVLVSVKRDWYVQERVDCVPNTPVTEAQAKFIRQLAKKYDLADVSCHLDPDRQPDGFDPWKWSNPTHNWTVDIHGIPIIFDYDF